MKTNIFKAGVAMSLCIATFASCSDKIAEDYAPLKGQVPLEVSIAGINGTRSIITGTLLPETCEFGVFFNSTWPVTVTYENGNCSLTEPIFLDENTTAAPVYAFYPQSSNLVEILIDTENQTDYLRGVSVDDGMETNIGFENPKAIILFDHILARITLNIHKDAAVEQDYKLPDIYLGGDNENCCRKAYFNAETNNFFYFDPDRRYDIKGELKDGEYLLDTEEDVITVDFLVIPTETTWMLNIKDLSADWYPLPATNYEAGKQYIYDCILKNEEKPLTITACDILPWQSTTMPGVETY